MSGERYEADRKGNVYVCDERGVWPTGIRVRSWASRCDISQEEFDRELRRIADMDSDALAGEGA